MAQRTIRHGLFRYYNPEMQIINGEEKEVLVERMAFHNETVDIPRDVDVERGDRLNAFWSVDDAKQHYAALGIPAPIVGGLTPAEEQRLAEGAQPAAEDAEEVELADLDDEDLVDWLMGTGRFDGQPKPTVNEVVAAAGSDPALAERLTKAEHTASGDAPRQGVVDGLSKVTA